MDDDTRGWIAIGASVVLYAALHLRIVFKRRNRRPDPRDRVRHIINEVNKKGKN